MIPVLIMLPTKLVNIIQYGGNVKAISLLPFWGNTLMEQVISMEKILDRIFCKYKLSQVKAAGGGWLARYSAKSFFAGLLYGVFIDYVSTVTMLKQETNNTPRL